MIIIIIAINHYSISASKMKTCKSYRVTVPSQEQMWCTRSGESLQVVEAKQLEPRISEPLL